MIYLISLDGILVDWAASLKRAADIANFWAGSGKVEITSFEAKP